MLEEDLIKRDDLFNMRESFVKLFKDGLKELETIKITDESFERISRATMYCLENVFALNHEISRVDKLREETAEKNTTSPVENK